MKSRTLLVLGILLYLFCIACAAYVMLCMDADSDVQMGAMYAISSVLTFCTIILALFYVRSTPSEQYKEMYQQDDENRKKE